MSYGRGAMRCRLKRDYHFEAAHRLPNVPAGHKCFQLHGHSYSVAIFIEGEIDPTLGWLMDFAEIDQIVDPVIKIVDHHYLNEIEGLENSTSEILAGWMWNKIKANLPMMVELWVSETADSVCIYRGE